MNLAKPGCLAAIFALSTFPGSIRVKEAKEYEIVRRFTWQANPRNALITPAPAYAQTARSTALLTAKIRGRLPL
jgi:hypothetical protein